MFSLNRFHNRFIEICQSQQMVKGPFSLKVQLHGQNLIFYSDSEVQMDELQSYFPKTWLNVDFPVKAALQVSLRSPQDFFGGPTPFWGDSVSPECSFFEDFVFQRDFWCQRLHAHMYQVVCEETLGDGFFNFLRFLLPKILLAQGKVLFHSSAVVDDHNQALLFFGFSGAGKTTMTGFCDGAQILGDDMCVLSFNDRAISVEPALVGQSLQDRDTFGKKFPVLAGFWLEKAEKLKISPMAQQRRGRLLSSFAGLFWDQLEQETFGTIFQAIAHLERGLDLYTLGFPKRKEAWNDVREFSKNILQNQYISVADHGGRYLNY